MVEKATHSQLKWHSHSPIFPNYGLLAGGVPFSITQWSYRGIHILSDVCNEEGLRMFNDLQLSFELPGSSFFLYLQLRSSMRAYGVPWEQPLYTHELHVILDVGAQTSGLVSKLYNILLSSSCGPLHVHLIWERDLDHHDGDVDWFTVWDNLDCTSKNPNHELIHFNFIHSLFIHNLLYS